MSSEEGAALAAFWAARLDEAERTVHEEGSPPRGVIAWLTYHQPDGTMGYTTVAHGDGEDGPWIFDGKELPEPASVLVVYDPVAVLRDVAADRALIEMLQEQAGYDLPEGVHDGRDPDERECDEALLGTLEQVARIRVAIWCDHPDYRREWKQ